MEEHNRGYVLINLMPYREKIKQQKIKMVVGTMSGFIFLSLLLLVALYSLISLQIDNQIERNDFINKENKKLDANIKEISNLKEEIKQTLAKRKVVEDLQVDRSDVVNILNIISNQLPEGMSLKSIKQTNNILTIIGLTQSNNKVSNYMINLESANFFTKPELVEIKSVQNPTKKQGAKVADDQSYSEFIIKITIKSKLPAEDIKDKNKNIKKAGE